MSNMSANDTKLSQRLDALQLQPVKNDTSRSHDLSAPEAIQVLQDDVALIKQVLSTNMHGLRHEIASLQQRMASGTEVVEIRTHEEKLQSATRNPSLIRIATGATLPRGLSRVDGHLREAAELESMAEKLRQLAAKTKSGLGKSYIREAEDADALAMDLRERAVEAGTHLFTLKLEAQESMVDDSGISKVETFESVDTSDVHEPHDHDTASCAPESRDTNSVSDAQDFQKTDTASETQEFDTIEAASESQDLELDITDTVSQLSIDTPSESTISASSIVWQPAPIRDLAPLPQEILSQIPSPATTMTFTKSFLLKILGGINWSPGFYYVPPSTQDTLLPGGGFWLLDHTLEPLFPHTPGSHGCTLTPILRLPSTQGPHPHAYVSAPVFLSEGDEPYTYMGMYTPCRAPDHLDHTRSTHINPSIKQFWAEYLSSTGRGDWITTFLTTHLFPRPTYNGPTNDVTTTTALNHFVAKLAAWEKDTTLRIAFLKPEDVLRAFEEPDAAATPGIRFWCQYLECVDWDEGFFEVLSREAGVKSEAEEKEEKERAMRVEQERKWVASLRR